MLANIGDTVYFKKRRGIVVGYTTFKRIGSHEATDTYLVVQLDYESSAYLEPRPGYGPDTFISLMVVHPDSLY